MPFWKAGETVAAGTVRMTALGLTIKRNAHGTARPSYDATEAALWTVTGGTGGGGAATTDASALTTGTLDPARIADGSLSTAKLTGTLLDAQIPAGIARDTELSAAVAALVNSAPSTLDTLAEIATALAADESAASALATTVGGKLAKASNLSDLTNPATARTNLGLSAVAATGAFSDLKVPKTEGIDFYAYGHSYVSGSGTTGSAPNYVTRLGTRLRTTTPVNRGVAGRVIGDLWADLISGARAWTPGTPGLVLVDCMINDGKSSGGSAVSFGHNMRSIVRALRASSFNNVASASLAFSAGWADNAFTPSMNGNTKLSSTSGSTITISNYTGSEIALMFLLTATGGGAFSVTVNGSAFSSFTLSNAGVLNTGSLPHVSQRITGLPAGANTLVLTKTDTTNTHFEGCLGAPVAAPPGIILVKDPYLASYTATGGTATDTTIDAFKAQIAAVGTDAEWGGFNFVAVADPVAAGWDKNSMIYTDAIHPNNIGHAVLADAGYIAAQAFGYRAGLQRTV